MANIKLGAIITDIAGSVGGSTFRRTPAGIILYNKQGTQIKSAFAKNSVKNNLGGIISKWSSLDQAVKDFYDDKATLYTFPDKFGNLKYLTGRQLYIKLNTQLIPTNTEVDIYNWDDRKAGQIVTGIEIDLTNGGFLITFDEEIIDFYCLVQVTPLTSGSNSKPRKKSYNTYSQLKDSGTLLDLYSEFIQQYPWASIGSYWNINVILMSRSGFQNSVQSFKTQILL